MYQALCITDTQIDTCLCVCVPVNYNKNFLILFIRLSSIFHDYKAFVNPNMEATNTSILITVETSSVIMFLASFAFKC